MFTPNLKTLLIFSKKRKQKKKQKSKTKIKINLNLNNVISTITINKEFGIIRCFIKILKNSFVYKIQQNIEIATVDNITHKNRFSIYYILASIQNNSRLIIKLNVDNLEQIESWCSLFNSTIALEREVYDQFGIIFKNHFDLRRILTDYGFEGYPLRKDFPLTGFVEHFYNNLIKNITINKSVKKIASQNF